LAKVEPDKVAKQNSDNPPEKKKPGPKKKVVRDRIDFVKKIDLVLQKVKEEHGIPIHNGISDQEVQKNLTKAQRLQIKKEHMCFSSLYHLYQNCLTVLMHLYLIGCH
jgi:hypothetical protein